MIYATGLGKTTRNPNVGEIPQYAAWIVNPEERLVVSPNGRVDYFTWFTVGGSGVSLRMDNCVSSVEKNPASPVGVPAMLIEMPAQ